MSKREIVLGNLVSTVAVALLAVGCASSYGTPVAPTQSATSTPATLAGAPATTTPTAQPKVTPIATVGATQVPAPASASTRAPVSLTPVSAGAEPTIQVTGQVRDVAASARVITFVEAVHGFEDVALTDSTQIIGPDGSSRTLQDIQPGMVVQAAGWANGSGAVIAKSVKIISGPTPLPQ
ncbi:MAG TPA: hypothetical protein VHS06_10700 [Chloroflexota bacterium]|nr:hypothetical protein [Chloroflexota bacterium]